MLQGNSQSGFIDETDKSSLLILFYIRRSQNESITQVVVARRSFNNTVQSPRTTHLLKLPPIPPLPHFTHNNHAIFLLPRHQRLFLPGSRQRRLEM